MKWHVRCFRGFHSVITTINDPVSGGGCEPALASDFRVASTIALFGQPEILLGILLGAGGIQRVARTVRSVCLYLKSCL